MCMHDAEHDFKNSFFKVIGYVKYEFRFSLILKFLTGWWSVVWCSVGRWSVISWSVGRWFVLRGRLFGDLLVGGRWSVGRWYVVSFWWF